MKIEIDSLDNILHICLAFKEKGMKKFPFPIYKSSDTLSGTAFEFGLYNNGKIIEGPGLISRDLSSTYFGYNKYLSKQLVLRSDTENLKEVYSIPFSIPFYAFKNLRAGENQLELRITQSTFCSENKFSKLYVDSLGDSTYHDVRNIMKAPLLSCIVKFKLNVPKIFKTTLYCESIELRNDTVYSPAGMDNTLWNSSYPDVYWTVDFPNTDFYCSSDYQRSTSLYDLKDTFYLYHYTPNDSIYIGVWDHDNLSRDDYISYERFSINQFAQNKITKFAFENIKEFRLKVSRQGYINK